MPKAFFTSKTKDTKFQQYEDQTQRILYKKYYGMR